MKTAFIGKLAPLFNAIAQGRDLYVPIRTGDHFSYSRYDAGSRFMFEFNNIRACTPVKEFLFPLRELTATLPGPVVKPDEIKPFVVFGLKQCDLRSIEALDKVFLEKGFEDPFYMAHREQMFVISADCTDPGQSCFCNILGGQPYPLRGFDLNVSQVKDGFVIEVGSLKGRDLIAGHPDLFALVPDTLLAERDGNRAGVQRQLERNNVGLKLNASAKEILEKGHDSGIFDRQAETCVECQACTRVCPTCHCFYLFDARRQDYFAKMKMWDSCMRMAYAEVAGGANPRRILGDRLRHRLMHKFAYFVDRYGLEMCVGCGRCVDAEAGGVDIREILKELNREFSGEGNKVAKASK